jgi:RNA polymerase sigma-70 factor (family 1)
MVEYSDDKLNVNNLKQGDVQSFDAIFKKYNKKVFYFALSYLKNKEEAEDVVQEVFINLWRYRDQINEYYVFSSYLFKITYNATCKIFRKQASDKKHLKEVLKDIYLEDDSTKLDTEYNSLLDAAYSHIGKLPSKQKTILLLSIEENLSADQIAEKLDISKKTVENYLSVAKRSLRDVFAKGNMLSVLFFWLFLK